MDKKLEMIGCGDGDFEYGVALPDICCTVRYDKFVLIVVTLGNKTCFEDDVIHPKTSGVGPNGSAPRVRLWHGPKPGPAR